MGNASARPPASGQQQLYLADPSRYLKEDMSQMVVIRRIGNGRFMKSYLCSLALPARPRAVVVSQYSSKWG